MIDLRELITGYRDRDDLYLTFVGERRLSYRDFFALADCYADDFSRTVDPGGIVVIDGVKSVESVAISVGCILSGRGYCYLDVTLPEMRKAHIISAVSPSLVFTATQGLNGTLFERSVPPTGPKRTFAGSVVFTSGSTGQPKGVLTSYVALAHYVDSMLDCMSDGPQTWLSICPVHFDVFQLDFLVQFARGADIVCAGNTLLPQQYLNIISETEVTEVLYISTLLKMTVMSVESPPAHRLKTIYFGGEGCSIQILGKALTLFPGVEFCQFYGPTENCNNTTYNRFSALRESPTGFMPLGMPIKHVRIHVVGDDGKVLGAGETGEIVISGPQLFDGYLDLATGSFEAWTGSYLSNDIGYFDEGGDLWFTGRKDDVVKVNGNRVSLAEIDNCIHERVRNATVSTVLVERNGFPSLISGVHSHELFDLEEVLSHLQKCLPRYSVPSELVRLPNEIVTRLSTGKTNYKNIKNFLLTYSRG